jgi:hypothetical protein
MTGFITYILGFLKIHLSYKLGTRRHPCTFYALAAISNRGFINQK